MRVRPDVIERAGGTGGKEEPMPTTVASEAGPRSYEHFPVVYSNEGEDAGVRGELG